MYLTRLEADGGLDRGFGDGGTVLLEVGDGGAASAVLVGADGRIVLTGVGEGASNLEILLARYLSDGRPDPTFGDAGLAGSAVEGSANALALQDDGKILVALARANRTLLARFGESGWLDTGFADGGLATPAPFRTPFGWAPPAEASVDSASAVVVLPSRVIATVGLAALDPPAWLVFTYWSPEGDVYRDLLPPDGNVVMGATFSSLGQAVGVDSRGNLVLAGFSADGDSTKGPGAVLRVQGLGTLDPSFGTGGVVREQPPGSSWGTGIVLQPDGKIVVGATSADGRALVLRRLWP